MELKFKQFLDETVKNWLLGGNEEDESFSLIPPTCKQPDELLYDLIMAEMKQDKKAIQNAKKAIDKNGLKIQISLVPK
jgi:hypothetical protein